MKPTRNSEICDNNLSHTRASLLYDFSNLYWKKKKEAVINFKLWKGKKKKQNKNFKDEF